MPSKSVAQRRFFGMAEHGKLQASKMPDMTKAQMHDFAVTPEANLPEHIADKKKREKRLSKRMGGHKHSDVKRGWS
jgi:hypothetical protein